MRIISKMLDKILCRLYLRKIMQRRVEGLFNKNLTMNFLEGEDKKVPRAIPKLLPLYTSNGYLVLELSTLILLCLYLIIIMGNNQSVISSWN